MEVLLRLFQPSKTPNFLQLGISYFHPAYADVATCWKSNVEWIIGGSLVMGKRTFRVQFRL